eukprot:756826-Hanusia_phi.AAC.2
MSKGVRKKKLAGVLTCLQLQERKQNIQRRKEKLEQILSELNNKKEELLKNVASLNEDMRQKVGTVADALDQREIELLNQINRLEQTKKTQQVEIREDLKVDDGEDAAMTNDLLRRCWKTGLQTVSELSTQLCRNRTRMISLKQ